VEGGDFNKTEAFFLSLIPSFIMGTGSAFGEATILGYLRNFPKDFVSGWSSGTGLAGVIGALVTLVFHKMDIKPKTMYLVISPVCLIYFFSFFFVERLYSSYLSEMKDQLIDSELASGLETPNETLDVSQNKNFSIENAGVAFKKGYRFIINLAAVYYLEYTINSGFGERVASKGYITDTEKDFQYEYFSLCYQIGVFFSRSSLIVVKHIKFVEIFTIIQFINFVIWFINVYTGIISISALAFFNFIIIGLMGGASYVACFYFLLNSESVENEYKELCINIASMMNDCGILIASLTVLFLDNTIMKLDSQKI
jgi:battenin